MKIDATYSPEDNKLRLRASARLDPELYKRVRAAGFIWAPKQDLFVAPMWTPGREDFALELAGEIGDEDTKLVDRAEDRAERFETYQDKRANDAHAALERVEQISGGIPLGQPILIGHHSEAHARRDAERIETSMRKAVKMWETSEYWERRAAGAIRHAHYKERPDVRARRIKGLEADLRKAEKLKDQMTSAIRVWNHPSLTFEHALKFAGNFSDSGGYSSLTYMTMGRPRSAYDLLYEAARGGLDDVGKSQLLAWIIGKKTTTCNNTIAHYERWVNHYKNRLTYERAMLASEGGIEADKSKPEKGGAVKCWVKRGHWLEIQKVNKVTVSVLDNWGNGGRDFLRTVPFDKLQEVMSAKDWQALKASGESVAPTPRPQAPQPDPNPFDKLKTALKSGEAVQVVHAPQLFKTPHDLARRMAAELQAEGKSVLEPSAGTGRLLDAVHDTCTPRNMVAVEVNQELCDALNKREFSVPFMAFRFDFLQATWAELGLHDRIIMNPPFKNAEDIEHIKHALTFLKPGGRLVALCADGPRQREQLARLGTYEPLGAGVFAEEGTGVNVALLIVDKPAS